MPLDFLFMIHKRATEFQNNAYFFIYLLIYFKLTLTHPLTRPYFFTLFYTIHIVYLYKTN